MSLPPPSGPPSPGSAPVGPPVYGAPAGWTPTPPPNRNTAVIVTVSVLAAVLVLGVIAVIVLLLVPIRGASAPPSESAPQDAVEGVVEYPGQSANHVEGEVDYDVIPPVGGEHNAAWLNCGVYSEPVPNENAVHSLEHGAVWIAYDPDHTTDAEVEAMIASAPTTYVIIAPYPGIGELKSASAWGAQLRFADVEDPAIGEFFEAYWRSPDGPEPNAPCTGGIDAAGRVG